MRGYMRHYILREAAKKVFFSGPGTKRGEVYLNCFIKRGQLLDKETIKRLQCVNNISYVSRK